MADGDQMSDTELRARSIAARVQAATEKLNVALLEAFEEGLIAEIHSEPSRVARRVEVLMALPLD